MSQLPPDHVERVYAGVLGKLIGVYIGRPFEGWTFDKITSELGHITYYVHDHPLFKDPLVITDDDISGTFQFVRALEEHPSGGADLSAEDIGRTWLNHTIEGRTLFWWGGRGMSTEHTAWLNLRDGIPAPLSGSIRTNGKTVAEQIGAQIFIDGWALASPGNPAQAARLARQAGSVSHDGESVYAAQLWAAMEAEAFLSRNVDHLLDTGLSHIPGDSLIAQVVSDVRRWAQADRDWLTTRRRIQGTYGYDKFQGACHVVPNHAVMIMALIYGGHSFDEAMHIVNTCGWDTDCNSGNIGCLVAIMHGLGSLSAGKDWRGPLADRALISSADNGYSINSAARIALDLVNTGRRLAGLENLPPPKDGAQFHFTLPGSVQGFRSEQEGKVKLKQAVDAEFGPALEIQISGLTHDAIRVATWTFTPPEVVKMRTYDLMASPLIYPGQTLVAKIRRDPNSQGSVTASLTLQVYTANDELRTVAGPGKTLSSAEVETLSWTIPDDLDCQPIQNVGLAVSGPGFEGSVWLDSLRWHGTPNMTLRRPTKLPSDFWRRAWVNGATVLHGERAPRSFVVSQSYGEGLVSYGTREWTDYRVSVPKFKVNLGAPCGVAVRVQGLNRYYGVVLKKGGGVALVKALDEKRIELSSGALEWGLDDEIDFEIEAEGSEIRAKVEGISLVAKDDQYVGGGIGLIATAGTISADQIDIRPLA